MKRRLGWVDLVAAAWFAASAAYIIFWFNTPDDPLADTTKIMDFLP